MSTYMSGGTHAVPTHRVEGRPMAEVKQILAADDVRWERLAAAWQNLMEDEQIALVERAEEIAASDVDYADDPDDPA